MKLKNSIFSLGFFAFSLMANTVQASDFHSPRTAALGGSGHAAPLLNDSIYLNPSYVSFLPSYGMSVNYLLYKAGNENAAGFKDYNGHEFNASLLDGRSEIFQAGVGVTLRDDSKLLSIGASKKLTDTLGVGLGGKFIFSNTGHDMIADTIVSVTYPFSDLAQMAFIIDNAVQTADGKAAGLYRELTLGTKINVEGILLLYADPHFTPDFPTTGEIKTRLGLELGMEIPVFTDFFLRIGKFQNSQVPFENRHGNGYGLGFGWIAPKVSIDYALQRVINPLSGYAHILGLTMFF